MSKQFKVGLGTVKGHCGVDKGLHQVINKIINSAILQLLLQLVFISVIKMNY